MKVHSRFINNSQKPENAQVSITKRVDKQKLLISMQLSNIQLPKENINHVDESQKRYTENKNPEKKNICNIIPWLSNS